jgi:hypothetical protein
MPEKEIEIEVVKDANYRTIVVNGLFGGHRPGYIEAIAYTQETDVSKALTSPTTDGSKISIRRILQCRLVIDPIEAKRIVSWLTLHISEYEGFFGKIIMPEEIEQKKQEEKPP